MNINAEKWPKWLFYFKQDVYRLTLVLIDVIAEIIVHLALNNGQNVIFEKQVKKPPYKTHIRKETEIIVHLALKYGQNKIFEKQEQNPP